MPRTLPVILCLLGLAALGASALRPPAAPAARNKQPAPLTGWNPEISVPPPPGPVLPLDPVLARPISIFIPGWPLDETLGALSRRSGVKLVCSKEVKDLKAVIYASREPLRLLLADIARNFRLDWRLEHSAESERVFLLVRSQQQRNLIDDLQGAEASYLHHREDLWLQSASLSDGALKAFQDAHPEVWGDAFSIGGADPSVSDNVGQFIGLLTPAQLSDIISGQTLRLRWQDLPGVRADAIAAWLVPDINRQRFRLPPGAIPDGSGIPPQLILSAHNAMDHAMLVVHTQSESGFDSASSQIVFDIRNMDVSAAFGRTWTVSMGAKLIPQDSPVYQALHAAPGAAAEPKLPDELARELAKKQLQLPKAGPKDDGTIDLPVLIAQIARLSGETIVSDYHYGRGRIPRQEVEYDTARQAAQNVIDHWRLAARKFNGAWLLRDREWWLYDQLDLPEGTVRALETSLAKQAELPLSDAVHLAATTTPEQFQALARWRLPQLGVMQRSHDNLAALASLDALQMSQARSVGGLPMRGAPTAVQDWVADRLDAFPDFPARDRDKILDGYLGSGLLEIRDVPQAEAGDLPTGAHAVNVAVTTSAGRRLGAVLLLPACPAKTAPAATVVSHPRQQGAGASPDS